MNMPNMGPTAFESVDIHGIGIPTQASGAQVMSFLPGL